MFQQGPFQQTDTTKEATIDTNEVSHKNPKSKKIVGEYIDFEEIG